MAECEDRACRDGIYKMIDEKFTELKFCMHTKADKLPKAAIIGIISVIITALTFVGGVPLMYSISAAKDKQTQIHSIDTRVETFNVKQDVIIDKLDDNERELEKIKTQHQQEMNKIREEINSGNKQILEAIEKGNGGG
jgi:septal ring factor EnvC (AmiA/AmiB activator)